MDSITKRLKDVEDFVEEEQGDDFVRWIMSQQIEVTAKTQGALLKAFRNDEPYDKESPTKNWSFFAGKYEIDADEIDQSDDDILDSEGGVPGVSHNDYFFAIKHILARHRTGALQKVPKNTLILMQTQVAYNPSVRMHSSVPKGRMVIIGLRYDTDEEWARNTLTLNRPNQIAKNAMELQRRWEPHSQINHMAEIFDTDSLPVFFRGRLSTVPKTFRGIERSAEEDAGFDYRLRNILMQLPDDVTRDDVNRLMRKTLRTIGDHDIRVVDDDDKVGAIVSVTDDSLRGWIGRTYRNLDDVATAMQETIDRDGRDSQDHIEDFEDLSYVNHWVKDQVSQHMVGNNGDGLLAQAIKELTDAEEPTSSENVKRWVIRTLEDEDIAGTLYRNHLKDDLVPSNQHEGKNALWEKFQNEASRLVDSRLPMIMAQLGELDDIE